MSFSKKIIALTTIFVFQILCLPPLAWAQSSLDDIKSKLEGAGIEVVDYSAPTGEWGSLNAMWVSLLTEKGYDGISKVAESYKDYFVGEGTITDLKTQLAISEAEKTRLTQVSQIQEKEVEIESLKSEVLSLEEDLKDELATLISSLDFKLVGEEATPQLKEEGVNLLALEIDFYYNYNKWGPLPKRIAGILESNLMSDYNCVQDTTEAHNCLQELAEAYGLTNLEPEEREAGLKDLEDELSKIPDFSDSDVALVTDSTMLVMAAGESQLNQVGVVVARTIQNIAAGIAILWIVIAGIRMVFAQGDEAVITEQKNGLLYGVIGLVIILLMGRIVEVLYGPAGVNRTELMADEGFSTEVYGIVGFLKALVGTIAVLFIVLSSVRTLFTQGDEAEITKNRTSILWIGAGLILIAINEIIIKNIFIIPASQSDQITSSNIAQIVNTFGNVMKFLLGFVGVITLGILVYGAGTMIMNFGNDEVVTNAKKIITNAIVGILVILSAYVIVASLITFS